MAGSNDHMPKRGSDNDERFERDVAAKEARMRLARKSGGRGIWFGLGMFGLVGWSVSVPVLLATLLGVYLDRRTGGGIRWTLSLMTLGFLLGGINAWNWVERSRIDAEAGTESDDGADRTVRSKAQDKEGNRK